MTVVELIDNVTEWAQKEICDRVHLKVPPDDDSAPVDAGYQHTLVTPTAFPLFVPSKDKLPPNTVAPIPSLCVRFIEGTDALDGTGGVVTLQFVFSTWDVGHHGKDFFHAQKDGSYKQWSGPEADAYFRRNTEGWRDAWNWVDVALRALESTSNVAGYELNRQSPIEFGPLADQDNIPDFYPFWFCWVNFSLKYSVVRNMGEIEQLL